MDHRTALTIPRPGRSYCMGHGAAWAVALDSSGETVHSVPLSNMNWNLLITMKVCEPNSYCLLKIVHKYQFL
jgi:hypothetical protein